MFLDTNFLIDLSRELDADFRGPARRFLAKYRAQTPAVSVISLGELATGMNHSSEARQFLRCFRIVSLKPEIALTAADIDRELVQRGARLGENDNWIAGFARYYGVSLASNDVAFDRVPRLRRLPYGAPESNS